MRRAKSIKVTAVQFYTSCTDDEVLKLSAHHVTSDVLYSAHDMPHEDGLLSARMGPHAGLPGQRCNVCMRTVSDGCIGHAGHMELDTPVPHPLFADVEIRYLLVPPPALRPSRRINNRRQEHAWTTMLRLVLRAKGKTQVSAAVQKYFFEAHEHMRGLTYGWTGKEGMFRQQLLGRRTGMCARAVITPCSALNLDEIGVPLEWATKLTIPEYVAPFNIARLSTMDGVVPLNPQLGQLVERPLSDGDYVIINRQPTLSQHSIMGMRVRLTPGHTLQLNPLLAAPFNADFDGDEMTLFCSRSLMGRAESMILAQPQRCTLRMIQDASTNFSDARTPGGKFGGFRTLDDMHAEAQRRYAKNDASGITVTLHDFATLKVPAAQGHTLAARAQHALDHTPQANSLLRMVQGGKGKPFNLVKCSDFVQGLSAESYMNETISVRTSLVATYRKTPHSGYMNRKVCSLLDGVNAAYDGTIRENGVNVVRFCNDLGFEPGGNLGADIGARLSRDITQSNLNSFHNAGTSVSAGTRSCVEHLLRGKFPHPSFCPGAKPRRCTPPPHAAKQAREPSPLELTFHYINLGKKPPRYRYRFAAAHAEVLREAFAFVFQQTPQDEVIVSVDTPYSAPKWVGVPGSPCYNAQDFAENVLPAMPTTAATDNLQYMLATLGVEACRAALLQRLQACSSAASTACALYADFATRTGQLRFATRSHIQQRTAPVAAAAFETTISCLRNAAQHNVKDCLLQASAYMAFNATLRQPFDAIPTQSTPSNTCLVQCKQAQRCKEYKAYTPAVIEPCPTK